MIVEDVDRKSLIPFLYTFPPCDVPVKFVYSIYGRWGQSVDCYCIAGIRDKENRLFEMVAEGQKVELKSHFPRYWICAAKSRNS